REPSGNGALISSGVAAGALGVGAGVAGDALTEQPEGAVDSSESAGAAVTETGVQERLEAIPDAPIASTNEETASSDTQGPADVVAEVNADAVNEAEESAVDVATGDAQDETASDISDAVSPGSSSSVGVATQPAEAPEDPTTLADVLTILAPILLLAALVCVALARRRTY
ncbi:MAG: hypothetical protein AAFQ67_06765, partial [Pseudomonadota bacterium]